jgi:hypothetical protein
MKLKSLSAVAIGAAAVGTLALTTPASAVAPASQAPSDSTSPSPRAHTEVHRAGMTVTGFDMHVARQHGYRLQIMPDGTKKLVNATTGQAAPSGTVGGGCGTSSVYIQSYATKKGFSISTGFHVVQTAIGFGWHVDTYGPEGFRDHWGHPIFSHSWHGAASHDVSRGGKYEALVTSPAYAILIDGAICSSNHPSDVTFV